MNELKHIDEFREILNKYRLSDSAKQKLAQIKLVLLVGPTSSGRNTIINELVKTGSYRYIISDTTRQPRMNNGVLEQDGREYWFRSEEDLLEDLRNGEFLEAAVIHNQQVSGISIRELEIAEQANKIAINEIEIVGADNIHEAAPEAFFIFIIPPSFEVWMQRMQTRGELPKDEIRRRLESACKEFEAALQHDYYVVLINADFVQTAEEIRELVEQGVTDTAAQAEARKLTSELLASTQAYLASH